MYNKPSLVIHSEKLNANIDRMLQKAIDSHVIFRPHFKTHQSAVVGDIFRKKGVTKITVSSVSMAHYFYKHGWDDITIAFPVNLKEIDEINELAAKIKLNLLVDSVYSTQQLSRKLNNQVGFFIEIDNGYHRSGLLPSETPEIDKILEIVVASRNMQFSGFLTHAGNSYNAKGKAEILEIVDDAAGKLQKLKDKYINRFPDILTSYGDTPSCSLADDLSGFDEIRPGNFVYYDVMQYHIGSCSLDDVAVVVACPVVSVYEKRNELIIYGGAVHLSKEFIAADHDFKLFGYVVELKENGWSEPIPGAYLSSISQEHGIVKLPKEKVHDFKPGDTIGILPVHSCLTADLLKNQKIIH